MKVQVNKYVFVGYIQDVESFVCASQKAGLIKFGNSNLNENVELEREILKIKSHYFDVNSRVLSSPGFGEETEGPSKLKENDAIYHVNNVILLQKREVELQKEKEALIYSIKLYDEFGIDFLLEVVEGIPKNIHMSLMYSERKMEEYLEDYVVALFAGSFKGKQWFLIFEFDEENSKLYKDELFKDCKEFDIRRRLFQLHKDLEGKQCEIESILKETAVYSSHIGFINQELVDMMNAARRKEAIENAEYDVASKVFFIDGWIKENEIMSVNKMCLENCIMTYKTDPQDDEIIPTALENTGYAKVGETIVSAYDIPSYWDRDMSNFVLYFFMVFYGIIIGDAGYGALQVCVCLGLLLKNKFPKYKSFLSVGAYFGVATIFWGLCTGNVFGIDIAHVNSLQKFVPIYHVAKLKKEFLVKAKHKRNILLNKNIVDFDLIKNEEDKTQMTSFDNYEDYTNVRNSILFELAILVGCVHLIFGMLLDSKRKHANIGWAIALFGAFFVGARYMDAVTFYDYVFAKYVGFVLYQYSMGVAVTGLIVAIAIAIAETGLLGILEVVNVIQIFSDVMSYLRLYALGLSSGVMGATFNYIGVSLGIFGIPVILIGHSINIILSLMGGAIHGTRLNFIEWFRYCFEGGGLLFKPLKEQKSIDE